jgi:hypothetical protein
MAAAPTDTDRRPVGEIIGLRPTVTGAYVQLRCASCQQEFESYQPTLAGVPVGTHGCPGCGATSRVTAERFAEALDSYAGALTLDEMARLTAEATRIAETWHGVDAVARLLKYRDVPLGPATERGLLASITRGLVKALDGGSG